MTAIAGSASPAPDEPRRGWSARMGAALTHRNYRVLWFAALGSTIGTWMQSYAQSWLVFDLTKSNFYLGLDSFLGQLPILLLMLIGGVIADRHDRRRLLTGSQYVQAFSALTLATLVATGHVTITAIFALSFLSGCGQAFGGPAYQAMIPSLVPRRDLPNAIALNSTQFNLSRVLGPALGGLVLIWIGVAWCFTLNGLSFFIVVVALATLRLPPHVPNANPQALRDELRRGLKYVGDNRPLVVLTALAFVTTSLAMPIATFFPTFATQVLSGNETPAQRLSMLMACQGLGAILGALVVGTLGPFKRMGRSLLTAQILLGLFVAAFAASRSLPLSLAADFHLWRLFDGGVLDRVFARAADRAGRSARPDRQHLHGGAPERRTDRRPDRRRARGSVHGAGRDDGQRRPPVPDRRDAAPAPDRRAPHHLRILQLPLFRGAGAHRRRQRGYRRTDPALPEPGRLRHDGVWVGA